MRPSYGHISAERRPRGDSTANPASPSHAVAPHARGDVDAHVRPPPNEGRGPESRRRSRTQCGDVRARELDWARSTNAAGRRHASGDQLAGQAS